MVFSAGSKERWDNCVLRLTSAVTDEESLLS